MFNNTLNLFYLVRKNIGSGLISHFREDDVKSFHCN